MRRTQKEENGTEERLHKNPQVSPTVSRRITPSTVLVLGLVAFVAGAFAEEPELGRRKLGNFKYDGSGLIVVNFFDADSTLRVAPSGNVSANSSRDAWILPGVSTKIAEEARAGRLNAIVSNQGGVPKNISIENADAALDFVRKMVAWLNPDAIFHYYDFAEKYDSDRKPGTGMYERLERILQETYGPDVRIDKERSIMVGDSAYKKADDKKGTPADKRPDGRDGFDFSNSDRLAAEAYGIKFIEPSDYFGWKKYGIDRIHTKEGIDQFFADHPELKLPVSGPCPFPSTLKKLAGPDVHK